MSGSKTVETSKPIVYRVVTEKMATLMAEASAYSTTAWQIWKGLNSIRLKSSVSTDA